jgi:SAM-dependent methyltransferase
MDRYNYMELSKLTLLDDFWLNAKADLVASMVKEGPILDVGSGSGETTQRLVDRGFEVVSIDIDPGCIELSKRFNDNVILSDFFQLKRKDIGTIKTVVLSDFLEHGDDKSILKKLRELISGDFQVIASIPAFKKLWSKNDDYCGHKRRYDKKGVRDLFEICGFEIKLLRYWSLITVPAILFCRFLGINFPQERISSTSFNRVLYNYFSLFENKMNFPFGSSIIVDAEYSTI